MQKFGRVKALALIAVVFGSMTIFSGGVHSSEMNNRALRSEMLYRLSCGSTSLRDSPTYLRVLDFGMSFVGRNWHSLPLRAVLQW